MRRNRKWQVTPAVLSKSYLDVGCGTNTHPDFVNLDWSWVPGVDLVWDLTRGFPLPNRSLKGIFTEHCLEHLSFEATLAVFREANRLLGRHGSIRIVVPSLTRYVEGLTTGEPPYREYHTISNLYTPAMSLNRIMHEHGHQFIYDADTLRVMLRREGLIHVEECSYGQGHDPVLAARDTPGRALESLYIEAVKG